MPLGLFKWEGNAHTNSTSRAVVDWLRKKYLTDQEICQRAELAVKAYVLRPRDWVAPNFTNRVRRPTGPEEEEFIEDLAKSPYDCALVEMKVRCVERESRILMKQTIHALCDRQTGDVLSIRKLGFNSEFRTVDEIQAESSADHPRIDRVGVPQPGRSPIPRVAGRAEEMLPLDTKPKSPTISPLGSRLSRWGMRDLSERELFKRAKGLVRAKIARRESWRIFELQPGLAARALRSEPSAEARRLARQHGISSKDVCFSTVQAKCDFPGRPRYDDSGYCYRTVVIAFDRTSGDPLAVHYEKGVFAPAEL